MTNEKTQKVYLDTFIFMDILSGEKEVAEKALQHIEKAKKTGSVVSAVLFAELSFHLRRRKSREKTEEIIYYIKSLPGIEIIPVNDEIAKHAGLLRAKYRRLKLEKKFTYLDCMHIATALAANCTTFITGDRGFKDVKEIAVEVY